MKIKEKSIDRFEHTMKIVILTVIIVFALLTITADASGLSSAKAVGMGGAHMGLARGVYASLYNPANLGLSGYTETGMEIAGVGAQIANNSFTLNDYNKYTGAVLSNEDKSIILGKIPADGLKISAEAEAGVMSVSYGRVVLSVNGFAATETNLGKEVLDLALNGNSLNETFSVEGMYSDAIAYASAGLSYGTQILSVGKSELAVGGTLKYVRGLAYEEITELYGGIVTLSTGFSGEGSMIARTSTGGNGYTVDIGAAYKFNDDYTVGITFSNVLSSIIWDTETEEHSYVFRLDTAAVDDFDNDSIFVSEDQTIEIPDFATSLPAVMRVGFANTSGKMNWAVDYIQGFKLAAGSSSKPELAAGAEYKVLNFLPIRAGYSVGGGKGSTVSGGIGLDFSLFYLDLAVTNHSLFKFSNTKGLHLAISTGLRF